jgi:hypothetical protein
LGAKLIRPGAAVEGMPVHAASTKVVMPPIERLCDQVV